MTTYDGNTGVVIKTPPVLDELEEVTITAVRPKPRNWSGLVYALLAGVVVLIVDDMTGKKRRRR